MATSENRREVAERLREAIIDDGHADMPGEKRGFQVTLRRIIGTSNPTRPALYARLADLIDPTSTVELTRVVFDEHCRTRWVPTCSACGSPARYWEGRREVTRMATEAQIKAQKKYDAENTRQVHLKLNRRTDEDVLEKLDSVPSKQGYIKSLIRADLKK